MRSIIPVMREAGLSDWINSAGKTLGDDVLGRVTDELGLPSLPPLQAIDESQNVNNYVKAYPVAVQAPAPEVNNPKSFVEKYWKIGAAAGGVVALVYLISRRK